MSESNVRGRRGGPRKTEGRGGAGRATFAYRLDFRELRFEADRTLGGLSPGDDKRFRASFAAYCGEYANRPSVTARVEGSIDGFRLEEPHWQAMSDEMGVAAGALQRGESYETPEGERQLVRLAVSVVPSGGRLTSVGRRATLTDMPRIEVAHKEQSQDKTGGGQGGHGAPAPAVEPSPPVGELNELQPPKFAPIEQLEDLQRQAADLNERMSQALEPFVEEFHGLLSRATFGVSADLKVNQRTVGVLNYVASRLEVGFVCPKEANPKDDAPPEEIPSVLRCFTSQNSPQGVVSFEHPRRDAKGKHAHGGFMGWARLLLTKWHKMLVGAGVADD